MIAFDDPVHAAQRTFRTLLAALAYPGRLAAIDDAMRTAPHRMSPALAAAALALFDDEVAVWLPQAAHAETAAWLRAHTGCRFATDPAEAEFAVILDPVDALPLTRWNPGTPEDPETSTTLLVQVESLDGGETASLRGPGIATEIGFAPRALGAAFWEGWAQNAARYPLGVDCFVFDAARVGGLPRTTRAVRA